MSSGEGPPVPTSPTSGPMGPESFGYPERGEAFLYPVEGKQLIKEIQEAEGISRLETAIHEGLAFREGLSFGTEQYDLEQPAVLLDLQTRFTSKEGMLERPGSWYIDAAIREKIGDRVREIKSKAKSEGRGLDDMEKREITRLMELEGQREGRKVVDTAFLQRTQTCEAAAAAAALVDPGRAPDGRLPVAPDAGHWMGALSGRFGELTDVGLRMIVQMGMNKEELAKVDLKPIEDVPDTVYTTGFTDSALFKRWLGHVLEATEGRMDAAWMAWRLALTWQLPTQIGAKTVKDAMKFPDPAIGDDLSVWAMWFTLKQIVELGYDQNMVRTRPAKYFTHTGHPLTINHLRNIRHGEQGVLVKSFLHEAVVEYGGKKVSFWELWWEKKMKIGGNFSEDKNILPYALTEAQPRGQDTDELPPGSYGFWLLQRMRAYLISKFLRSFRGLKDMVDPTFYANQIRTFEKVLGVVDDDMEPEENYRYWISLADVIWHYPQGRDDAYRVLRGKIPEYALRVSAANDVLSAAGRGSEKVATVSLADSLRMQYQCGWLRKKDIEKLLEVTQIQLRSPKDIFDEKM